MKLTEINQKDFEQIIATGITVVDFFADWCGPCKMLSPQLEKAADALPDVHFVKVNVDHSNELAARFNIQSIPTVLMFKDNKLVGSFMGYIPQEKIIHFVNSNR